MNVFMRIIVLLIITSALLAQCNDCPNEPTGYYATNSQAFLFIPDSLITLLDEPLDTCNIIVMMNNGVIVGQYNWDASLCGPGGICSIPLMGYDGSDWSEGYLVPGDPLPQLLVFDLDPKPLKKNVYI